jgi:hypothetical protein
MTRKSMCSNSVPSKIGRTRRSTKVSTGLTGSSSSMNQRLSACT